MTLTPTTGLSCAVTDAGRRDLGTILVEEVRGPLVLGTFTPGPDYPAVAGLFDTFDELVSDQCLSLLDNVCAAIADLDIRVTVDGRTPARVDDVQIWKDGGASFQLRDRSAAAERNGTHN